MKREGSREGEAAQSTSAGLLLWETKVTAKYRVVKLIEPQR